MFIFIVALTYKHMDYVFRAVDKDMFHSMIHMFFCVKMLGVANKKKIMSNNWKTFENPTMLNVTNWFQNNSIDFKITLKLNISSIKYSKLSFQLVSHFIRWHELLEKYDVHVVSIYPTFCYRLFNKKNAFLKLCAFSINPFGFDLLLIAHVF